MGDQERLDLILAQARIAKAALMEKIQASGAPASREQDQALLAIEAIVLLADSEFHRKSDAA